MILLSRPASSLIINRVYYLAMHWTASVGTVVGTVVDLVVTVVDLVVMAGETLEATSKHELNAFLICYSYGLSVFKRSGCVVTDVNK